MPRIDMHKTYLEIAKVYSKMSYAKRKKVGAILVKDGRIISTGYNGMPSGMDNVCEESITCLNELNGHLRCNDKKPVNCSHCKDEKSTKPEVIHAEMNAILFAAKNGQSTEGCTLYLTLSPCIECAKAIIQSGIKSVYYSEEYRNTEAISFLNNAGIKCIFYR